MENLYAKTEEAVFFPQGSDPATLRVGSPSIFLDKLGKIEVALLAGYEIFDGTEKLKIP